MNSRALRAIGPLTLAGAALVTVVWALSVGGGAEAPLLVDPGPTVRWGLPIAKLVVNLTAAGMVGTLVTALYALKTGTREFSLALALSSASAAIFTVASAATGLFAFIDAFNADITLVDTFGVQLGRFITETELGRTWLITAMAGAVLTIVIFAARSATAVFLVALLALASLVPMGTQGHSGDEANHNAAMTALVLHIIAAAVWLGGLLLMVVIRPVLDRKRMAVALSRYSTIALVAFVVVAGSGIVRAAVTLVKLDALWSPYGAVLMSKVLVLLAIGILGAWYRTRLISRLRDEAASRVFWWLILAEFALMGIAAGAAAALARTPTPVDTTLPEFTPAVRLTGAPLPPEFTAIRWVTAWEIDWLWMLVACFGAFFYLAGVWRMRRRGDGWPLYRTILWLLGLVSLVWVTSGAINAYQDYLFSVHMIGHMLLTMAIPLLLVTAAPITLAMRSIRRRKDGSRGGREWIMWAVHSPVARILTHPLVAAGNFVLSLWVFYYTDLFRWSLYDHLGHVWMVAHFLITGYLFVQSLIGIDPVPLRLPYPFRLVSLIAVMALHAFFGVAIMMQSGLMAAEWFGSMGRTWGATPLADQYAGGGIAWSVGEIPTLILAIIVAIQWSRSDDRLQRRRDRHTDRFGDAELDAYNAHLARLAERDAQDARAGRRP